MKEYLTQFFTSRYWNYSLITVFLLGVIAMCYGGISLVIGFKEQETRFSDQNPQQRDEVLDLSTQHIATESARQKQEKGIRVYVSGAVKKPGVYEVQASARVHDAIELAGGFSAKADGNQVAQRLNLAEKLQDAQHIYVPTIGEVREPGVIPGEQDGRSESKINLNTATELQLETLAGVGPVLAKKIIQARPYTSFQDFVTRSQVPLKLAEQIRDETVISTDY